MSSVNSPPKRPLEITDAEKASCDVRLDDNTRIVLSLDVFHQSNETALRVSAHNQLYYTVYVFVIMFIIVFVCNVYHVYVFQLVQANVPQGPGRYQRVCIVITNSAVYVTQYGELIYDLLCMELHGACLYYTHVLLYTHHLVNFGIHKHVGCDQTWGKHSSACA